MRTYGDDRPCTRCGESPPYVRFFRVNRGKHRRSYCVRCHRLSTLASMHKVTMDYIEELYASQEGKCRICERELLPPGYDGFKGKRTILDHDHITGEIRGILCDRCNMLLGLALEDTLYLKKAITYLERQG